MVYGLWPKEAKVELAASCLGVGRHTYPLVGGRSMAYGS
jgi:hypothetical protein